MTITAADLTLYAPLNEETVRVDAVKRRKLSNLNAPPSSVESDRRYASLTQATGHGMLFDNATADVIMGTGDWSMWIWIKPVSVNVSRDIIYRNVSGTQRRLALIQASNAKLQVVGYNDAGSSLGSVTSTPLILADTWQLVAIGYSPSTRTLRLSLDGAAYQTATLTGDMATVSTPLTIGYRGNGSAVGFSGLMSNWTCVQKVATAGSSSELEAIYQAGPTVVTKTNAFKTVLRRRRVVALTQ